MLLQSLLQTLTSLHAYGFFFDHNYANKLKINGIHDRRTDIEVVLDMQIKAFIVHFLLLSPFLKSFKIKMDF